jgi:spore protease
MRIRTDLALEAREFLMETAEDIPGVNAEEIKVGSCNITRIKVDNDEGSKKIGHPLGTYITIEMGRVPKMDEDEFANTVDTVAHELSSIMDLKEGSTVLVTGLGNIKITPDALGPKTVENVMVTRHISGMLSDYFNPPLRQVSAISPGVLGQTGVETAELIKGVTERVKPDYLIVIDALSARKLSRVATTVQISNAGIAPGSGVGNKRVEINKESLGVPVIAVGVPTVVDAATMAGDVISLMAKGNKVESQNDYESDEAKQAIRQSLEPFDMNLVVTPTEIDTIIDQTAKAVGYAINRALHSNVSMEEIEKFLA